MTLQKLTVGIDGSDSSESLLRWADDLAGRNGARLRAVTVWHLPYLPASAEIVVAAPPVAEIQEQTRRSLMTLIESVPRRSRIEPLVSQGSAAQVLMDVSVADDLLVVSRRGVGGLRGLGSTSRHCAIHASCPVAVVPAEASVLSDSPRLAVAVDGSRSSAEALAWALANFPGSPVDALNSESRHDPPAAKVLGSTIAAARELAQVEWPVEPVSLAGDPRSTVLDAAADRELLVVGDRGHSGVAGLLLGSFATFAVGHAPPRLPVIVVRTTRETNR